MADRATQSRPVAVAVVGIRRRRKWIFRLTTFGLAVFIALAAGEVGLRLWLVQEGKRLATYDIELGWRGRPHGAGIYARKSDQIAIPFRYNELGYRDQEVRPKPAGGKRLLILGDSFVESLEVKLQQTFPALVEETFHREHANWDVSLIGSQGYSTAQELLAFRKFQPTINADAVLLCFYCGNDFDDNLRSHFAYLDEQRRLVFPGNTDPSWQHLARGFQRWLYESSHVVYLVKNSVESFSSLKFGPESKSAVVESESYQREITEKLLLQLNEEVGAAAGNLAIMIIPARTDLLAGNSAKAEWIKQLCESHQIPYLDLSPRLAAEHFFGVDLHFNTMGHAVVAQALEEFLSQCMLGNQNPPQQNGTESPQETQQVAVDK